VSIGARYCEILEMWRRQEQFIHEMMIWHQPRLAGAAGQLAGQRRHYRPLRSHVILVFRLGAFRLQGFLAEYRPRVLKSEAMLARDDPGPGVGNAEIPPDSSKSRFISAILIALATILQLRISFSLSRPAPQRSSLLIDGVVDFLYRSYDLFELGCRAENHGSRLCIIGL